MALFEEPKLKTYYEGAPCVTGLIFW